MSTKIQLYHYSIGSYPQLLTREKQGITSSRDDSVKSDYNRHISFFFEPPPLDILGTLYGPFHSVWVPGQKLFEYTVELDALGEFYYHLVESPELVQFRLNPAHHKLSDKIWDRRLEALEKELGYIGEPKEALTKAIELNLGKTRNAYIWIRQSPYWEEVKFKYAAYVPHLMIYPKSGRIDYKEKRRVIVGNGAVPVIKNPTYSQWDLK